MRHFLYLEADKGYMKIVRVIFAASLMLPLSSLIAVESPQANLEEFSKAVEPVLKATCVGCHGPEKQKGKFRIDTLDPDAEASTMGRFMVLDGLPGIITLDPNIPGC